MVTTTGLSVIKWLLEGDLLVPVAFMMVLRETLQAKHRRTGKTDCPSNSGPKTKHGTAP